MKGFIGNIFLSLVLVIVWGVLMLSAEHSTNFHVFLSFLFTAIIHEAFRRMNTDLSLSDKVMLLFFPMIYMILSIVVVSNQIWTYNPLVWNLALLIGLLFTKLKNISRLLFLILILSYSYFYSYTVYDDWERSTNKAGSIEEITNGSSLKEDLIILDTALIDKEGKTIVLSGKEEDFYLIETWNETCVPCLESIHDLDDYITFNYPDISHVYLYVSNRVRFGLEQEEIYNFKWIKNRDKIYQDANNEFYEYSGMKGYPYFILFTGTGKYIDHFHGYSSKEIEYFKKRIDSMMSKS